MTPAAIEVNKLVKRGTWAAVAGLLLPVIGNAFSISWYVQAYDRSHEEFWRHKGLLAVGALCTLTTAASICIVGYRGYLGLTSGVANLVMKSCLENTHVAEQTRIHSCDNALKLTHDPATRSRIYIVQSNLYAKIGNLDRALENLNAAIEENPTLPRLYADRGNMLARKHDFDHAFADYTKAIELAPRDAYALGRRCYLYAVQGKLDLALADCNTAISFAPHTNTAYDARGFIYLKQKKYGEAFADFEMGLRWVPKSAVSL